MITPLSVEGQIGTVPKVVSGAHGRARLCRCPAGLHSLGFEVMGEKGGPSAWDTWTGWDSAHARYCVVTLDGLVSGRLALSRVTVGLRLPRRVGRNPVKSVV